MYACHSSFINFDVKIFIITAGIKRHSHLNLFQLTIIRIICHNPGTWRDSSQETDPHPVSEIITMIICENGKL